MSEIIKPLFLDETGKAIVEALTQREMTKTRIAEINAAADAAKSGIETKTDEQVERITEVTALAEDVNQLKEDLVELIGFDKSADITFIEGEYVDHVGNIKTYDSWHRTDYIELHYPIKSIITSSSATDDDVKYNVLFDENKNFIAHFALNTTVTIPSNAKYVMFSLPKIKTLSIAFSIKCIEEIKNDIVKESSSNVKISIDSECLSLRNQLPSYYTNIADNPTSYNDDSYIDGKIKSVPKGNHFLYITDIHWQSNAKKSNILMAYIKNRLGIKNVIHGGDILNFDKDNPYKAAKHMKEWLNEARASFGSGLLLAQGNHDINSSYGGSDESQVLNSIIPYSIVEDITLGGYRNSIIQETDAKILERISSVEFESEEDRENVIAYYKMHFYCDDDERKIRYIVLQHGNNFNGIIYRYFNVRQFDEVYLQMDWLYETLMSTPENYNVVVVNHAFINYTNNQVSSGSSNVTKMLNGLKRKDSNLRIANNNQIGETYPYGYHYYNFSKAPTVSKVICLGGDAHWDFACKMVYDNDTLSQVDIVNGGAVSENDVLVVHTQTDAYGCTYPSGTYISDTWEMTPNTVTEQCFDVVTIEDNKVTFTRIGAGEDRVFTYS